MTIPVTADCGRWQGDSLASCLGKMHAVTYSYAWHYVKAASEDILFLTVIATKC